MHYLCLLIYLLAKIVIAINHKQISIINLIIILKLDQLSVTQAKDFLKIVLYLF